MKNITDALGSIGCIAFVVIVLYAFTSGRIIELVIIYLSVFGLIFLIEKFVIEKLPEGKQNKIKNFFSRNTALTGVLLFLAVFGSFLFGNRIIDGLTPADKLAIKLHEQSKYKFSGSKCKDGWISFSQGSGTCSWHGGVRYEFNKGDYQKSMSECKREALKLSWID